MPFRMRIKMHGLPHANLATRKNKKGSWYNNGILFLLHRGNGQKAVFTKLSRLSL